MCAIDISMIAIDTSSPSSFSIQIAHQVSALCVSCPIDFEQLPSVREVSVALAVHPKVVREAYRYLHDDVREEGPLTPALWLQMCRKYRLMMQ